MILRTYFFVLACWLTGHSADGMYLKYQSSPSLTELTIETIPRNGNARFSRDVGKWIQSNRKKLVLLDRKNKFVAAFIQKLIKLIEKEKNSGKPTSVIKLDAQKIPCRSFGHLYNSRFRNCVPSSQAPTKPTLKLMTVNVIPIKSENVFLDSTRQGSDDEFENFMSSETDSFSDTSDYTDDDNFERRARIVRNFRRQGHALYNSDDEIDESNMEYVLHSLKKLKRFDVITNGKGAKKKPRHQINVYSQSDSDEEEVQTKNDSEEEEARQEDTDSDQEKVLKAPTYSAKKIKTQDTDEDSDIEGSDVEASDIDGWGPIKQEIKPKSTKKPTVLKEPKYGELTSFEVSEEKTSKKKKQSNNYVYLQGPEPVNSDMEAEEDDARRYGMNRLKDFFMPKRNIWDSSEIQHLSYYWFNGPQGHVLYS